ncbi:MULTISPECIES: hypothetical protein [Methylobacterium]|uniref:Uncharacterized protein n=2 Tax=Methylobacterium TaxID=407 RepID=A0A0C6FBQ0_9HYPH|nr:hypothetical protein [Methylobacterium aquaticum]BAQ44242.1 hypothetical protein Maq22A_c04080 [Methylobacterium aquaticum]
MSDAFNPGILHAAQVSAIHALEILECVQVLLHSVEEDSNPQWSHRLCSGAYEIVELAHSHVRDVSEALSKVVDAFEAGARS